MNSTTMEQISKFWGLWGSTRSSSSTKSPVPSWAAAASSPYSSEPSWEEQAFARDSAAHLGGCVWPPRSYSCSFCQREFRSAQALGGHMNVHRRDRALLRQVSSSPEDGHGEAPVEQPQGGRPFFYRPASNPSTTATGGSSIAVVVPGAKGDVTNRGTAFPPPPPPPYLASIIRESNNKLFMSIPASMTMMRVEQAKDQCNHVDDDVESARIKRRRLDPLPSVTLPVFVQTTVSMTAENQSRGVDHDAKVPKLATISNPSSIPPLLDQQQEIDLELRLGSTPKVT